MADRDCSRSNSSTLFLSLIIYNAKKERLLKYAINVANFAATKVEYSKLKQSLVQFTVRCSNVK